MADEQVLLLREQLEKAKDNLSSVDENIRRLTGREPGERRSADDQRRVSVGSFGGSRSRGPLGQRQDAFQRLGPSLQKRPNLGSAFSRLGGRVGGVGPIRRPLRRERANSDEEDALSHKPTVQSSVVAAPKNSRTRKDSIEEQNKDMEGKKRNRRMFGLLLGTLQQFKADSSQTTEKDKRRDKLEKKLEQKAIEEKEALANERKFLFLERRAKQAKLEELEQLMELAEEQDDWDAHAKNLSCFIRTKAKPHIHYNPRKACPISEKRHAETKDLIIDNIHKRREEIEEEIRKAGAEEDGEVEENWNRRRSGEERIKEGKEVDKGKPKERRRHSEGKGKEDKNEMDEESTRGRKRNGHERHMDENKKERDRRDDGRKRRRSERSRSEKEAGGDGEKELGRESGKNRDRHSEKELGRESGKNRDRHSEKELSRESGKNRDRHSEKELGRESGKNRDRHRSKTLSDDKKDKEVDKHRKDKETDQQDVDKENEITKEVGKKTEEDEKEEGEVMDTDEQSSKQTEPVDDTAENEEAPRSEQVGEVSSSNDNKLKTEQQVKEEEKQDEENAKEDIKNTDNVKEEQVPMEEGETRDDEDEDNVDQ